MPLKGIPPIISPDLLRALAMMGHGDDIVLADAYFPSHSIAKALPNAIYVRADGHSVGALLEAILGLIELDAHVYSPVTLMDIEEMDRQSGMKTPLPLWIEYEKILKKQCKRDVPISYLKRQAFYDRATKASLVIATSETGKYGNIMLTTGLVVPAGADEA